MTTTRDSPEYPRPRWFIPALLGITALAAALRWFRIAEPSMWVDELFTVRWSALVAQGGTGPRVLAYTPTALGYWLSGIDIGALDMESYAGWIAEGVREQVIRLPAFVTGVLSVLALGWTARRVVGWRASLVLAALLALSAWHVWGSQTARFYAQQFLFYNLAYILYFDGTRRHSRPAMVGAAVCVILAFLTQLTSLAIIGVFGIDWLAGLVRGEKRQWGAFGWACIVGATVACVGFYLSREPNLTETVAGFSGSSHRIRHLVLGLPFLTGLPAAILAVLTTVWLFREAPRTAGFLLAGMFGPLLAISLFALLGIDVHVRYLFVALFAWLAAASIGAWKILEQMKERANLILGAAPMAVVLAAMAFALLIYYQGAAGYRPRWREAFSYVREHRRPGERLAADYIPRLVGSYYLEIDREEIQGVGRSTTLEDFTRAIAGRPTWIVLRGFSATAGERYRWLNEPAELKAYFATRTFQPYSSIHVYFLDPR